MAQANTADGVDDGFLNSLPDVDRRSCQLLGPTALVVQGLMGVLVILSLVYKRHREKPHRPWRIWLFDVSKQVVGQMFVHGVNVLVSNIVSQHTSANACVFYFLNILIDTTLGVGLIYIILHVLTFLLTEKLHLKGFESGQYGVPPSFNYWLRQATIYVLSLTTMKFLVLALLVFFPGIFRLGDWLLSWTYTGKGDALQVIFTMGLFPITMNILQFWLIDSIVKSSDAAALALDADTPDPLDAQAREPLFRASDEDDEDDDDPRHDVENQLALPRPRSPPASRSTSRDKGVDNELSGSLPPYEPKASGTNTPADVVALHAYPPSRPGSTDSTLAGSSTSQTRVPKRRPPPKPLHLNAVYQPAINSPLPTPPQYAHPAPVIAGAAVAGVENPSTEWAESWEDSDDWATRVGEEDWTGRRIEEKKDSLNAWDVSPTIHIQH